MPELTEIQEELSNDVESENTLLTNLVETETDDAEKNGEDDEATKLDWLTANSINESNGEPVTRNSTSAHKDNVADSGVPEQPVDVGAGREANLLENDGSVQTKTVESNVKQEPRTSGANEGLGVLPLAVVTEEICPAGLGNLKSVAVVLNCLDTLDLVGNTLGLAGNVSFDIGAGLDDIAGDIKGVAGGFGDCQTIVESNAPWNRTETDDNTPHLVGSKLANAGTGLVAGGGLKRLLEASSDDESDETGGELAETLHSEDRAHHGASPFGGRESDESQSLVLNLGVELAEYVLRGDNGGKRVVTTNANTHDNAPEAEDTNNGQGRAVG